MNARDGFRSAIELMQQSARLMGAVMPARGLFCDWRELDNKFQAFRLFQYADRELGIPVDRLSLEEVVRRALTLDSFRRIWILEGIGALKGRAANLSVAGLLSEGEGANLPDSAMIPLHAGIGTAFGDKLLEGLSPKPSAVEVRDALERFVEICGANCRPGWDAACIEPIGLVVRTLYPHLLQPVSEALETLDPELRRLFWHGVGRSLYFVPTNFMPIPGARERMMKGAMTEATQAEDRKQVLAGLIWAVTLVNLPEPAVVRSLLSPGSDLQIRAEFTNGVISALLVWHHMAPGDLRYTTSYTRTQPVHDRESTLWKSWIESPARDALQNLSHGLERRNQIPALYQYRTLDELRELSGATHEAAQQSRSGAAI